MMHRFKTLLLAKACPKVGHDRYLDKSGGFHQRVHHPYCRVVQLRFFMTLDEENSVDLLAATSLLCPGCLEFEVMLFLQKNQKLL